jgi:hypothetical protein
MRVHTNLIDLKVYKVGKIVKFIFVVNYLKRAVLLIDGILQL